MTHNDSLTTLVNRIQSGDKEAIEDLITAYKEEAKAAIRHMLNAGNKLRRTLDSSDILHSIVIQFLRKPKEGRPLVEDGTAYLGTLARNRVLHHGRKMATQKRDIDRVSHGEEALGGVADRSPSPEASLMKKELLEAVLTALSPAERFVAAERMEYNKSWEEIAARTGEKADTIRKRFGRTMQMLEQSLLAE